MVGAVRIVDVSEFYAEQGGGVRTYVNQKLAEQLVDRRTFGRISENRRGRRFSSIEDVWRRAAVPVSTLQHIAAADGFRGLGLSRRDAAWAIKALRDDALPLFAAADDRAGVLRPEAMEPTVQLPTMTAGCEVVEDYRSTGLSLRAHPLAFLRGTLSFILRAFVNADHGSDAAGRTSCSWPTISWPSTARR